MSSPLTLDEQNQLYDQMEFPIPAWQLEMLSTIWLPVLLAATEVRDEQ